MKLFFILLSAAGIFISCNAKLLSPGSAAVEPEACPVSIHTVSGDTAIPSFTSFGTITFKEKTDISSSTEGRLREISIKEGDLIKKGDLLISLENLQLQIRKIQVLSELTSAKAALALSEARYREGRFQIEGRLITLKKLALQADFRQQELLTYDQIVANKRELLKADGISREEMREVELQYQSLKTEYLSLIKDIETASIGLRDKDIVDAGILVPEHPDVKNDLLINLNTQTLQAEVGAAYARIDNSRAELSSVELLLSNLSITAEKDGIVGAVYFQEGENITAGSKLLTVFQASPVYVLFTLPETDGMQLFVGQPVEVTLPALEFAKVTADISIISPTIDPQSGTVSVKALIENRENLLKPGMFANLKFQGRKGEEKCTIPIEALRDNSKKESAVFIIRNGRAFLREVTTGTRKNGRVEISEGLATGDKVVLSPPPCITEGADVRIIE